MTSKEIRQNFLDFFQSKQHQIVPSAPMVVKNDPTLMFINAGMNQFKDIFLGNNPAKHPRIADSQKCLRVSGKHNDLDEVGHDTYHHTMFEMLGNWSFGDYFKQEAIDFAWELLTGVYQIPKDRLYATIFEGDSAENVPKDTEALSFWKKHLDPERILDGSKKDNFWEMGDTGPCGPCSEIHIDLRDQAERQKINAAELINKDHPLVIEIWNLVFIQYNRKSNGKLEQLPQKHVDTGMGFERLCMVVQGKKSNYDTDLFQPVIQKIASLAGKEYGADQQADVAMRVIADHLRAVSFAIADGQLPFRNGAGYVIRRILRRAVRYGYTFLGFDSPLITKLVETLIQVMGEAYPELKKQQQLIEKVIAEEEQSFLRTLETGLKRLERIMEKTKSAGISQISGKDAFSLYDSSGFPLDLTELIVGEQGLSVDKAEYEREMAKQQDRSKDTAKTDDWVVVRTDDVEEFIGYDHLEAKLKITRYRKVEAKGKTSYQIVFNFTPFYAESGGQVGDTGYIEANGEKISILDTQKENDLIVHIVKKMPSAPNAVFRAVVNNSKRQLTACNHTATHLLHKALREILGDHVEQKGSLVDEKHLRFDFSHFQKLTPKEIQKIEERVNLYIRQNHDLEEERSIPMRQAREMGAMSLFGEKYGDLVRVVKFGNSIELCGGTHVKATGEIGFFKIVTETAIAAGMRRIEAITAREAEKQIQDAMQSIEQLNLMFKKPKSIVQTIENLQEENKALNKKIEEFQKKQAKELKNELKNKIQKKDGIQLITALLEVENPAIVKDLAYQLKGEVENLFLAIGANIGGKPNLTLMISDNLVEQRQLNAGKMIRLAAKEIKGGGGGQAFYATAGGKDVNGLQAAIDKIVEMIS